MEMRMYSVYDRKLREYGSVLLAPNDGVMARTILTGVRGSSSLMEKYPEDFQVEHVGNFDISTGLVTPVEGRPEIVISLEKLLEVENAPR